MAIVLFSLCFEVCRLPDRPGTVRGRSGEIFGFGTFFGHLFWGGLFRGQVFGSILHHPREAITDVHSRAASGPPASRNWLRFSRTVPGPFQDRPGTLPLCFWHSRDTSSSVTDSQRASQDPSHGELKKERSKDKRKEVNK